MPFIHQGRSYDTQGADNFLDGPFKIMVKLGDDLFELPLETHARLYKTEKQTVFMTLYSPSSEDSERFFSTNKSAIIEFLEQVGATDELYKKAGVDIQEA